MSFGLAGYGPSLVKGLVVTVALASTALLYACCLGAVVAWGKTSGSSSVRRILTLYTVSIRGVPDLVLMFLIYFGGQVIVNRLWNLFGASDYIEIDPFFAGSLTLGLIFGAYMAETFRGSYLSVPRGQIEAALALGLYGYRLLVDIVLPQLVRHGLPSFGNNWLVILKTTALVSLIGLDDLIRRAELAAGVTHEPFKFFAVAASLYLVLTGLSEYLFNRLEKLLDPRR